MNLYPQSLEILIEQFASLPGIGKKTAQRLAFYILSLDDASAVRFADAVLEAKNRIGYCVECCNLTDRERCPICLDERRDHGIVCVVSDPKDVIAFERGREYNGVYHVLHGVISPSNHVTPDKLKIKELLARAENGLIKEVIMATNPDTEGETTARYLARLLEPYEVRVTRLAYGIPVGANLEFADDVTLMRALEGRTEL